MLITGVVKPEQSVLEPLLVLCAQHSIALLRYWYNKTYVAIAVVLEIWFQWSVFSNLELYMINHWTVVMAAIGVVFAHWMWLCVGLYNLMADLRRNERVATNTDNEIDSFGTDSFEA